MQVVPPALDRLIDSLARLPGIGRKTATRLALNILRRPSSQARELAASLNVSRQTVRQAIATMRSGGRLSAYSSNRSSFSRPSAS